MTPEDVAAIRAESAAAPHPTEWPYDRMLALCDALEAAWAERDVDELRLNKKLVANCDCAPFDLEDEMGNPVCVCPAGDNCKAVQANERQRRLAESRRAELATSWGEEKQRQYVAERERAERAEAEHLNQVRLNLKMDAALARVRAAMDETDPDGDGFPEVRAAIEGYNQ